MINTIRMVNPNLKILNPKQSLISLELFRAFEFRILNLFRISCLVFSILFFVASHGANAGLIVKAPAYLGLQRGLVGCWNFDGILIKNPAFGGVFEESYESNLTTQKPELDNTLSIASQTYKSSGDIVDISFPGPTGNRTPKTRLSSSGLSPDRAQVKISLANFYVEFKS